MQTEVLNNYYRSKRISSNDHNVIDFKMDGDDANPYMIIHQD